MQPQGHVQIVCNLIDFRNEPPGSRRCPRIYHTGSSEPTDEKMENGGTVSLESGFPYETIRELMKKGHKIGFANGPYGGYQAIRWIRQIKSFSAPPNHGRMDRPPDIESSFSNIPLANPTTTIPARQITRLIRIIGELLKKSTGWSFFFNKHRSYDQANSSTKIPWHSKRLIKPGYSTRFRRLRVKRKNFPKNRLPEVSRLMKRAPASSADSVSDWYGTILYSRKWFPHPMHCTRRSLHRKPRGW